MISVQCSCRGVQNFRLPFRLERYFLFLFKGYDNQNNLIDKSNVGLGKTLNRLGQNFPSRTEFLQHHVDIAEAHRGWTHLAESETRVVLCPSSLGNKTLPSLWVM